MINGIQVGIAVLFAFHQKPILHYAEGSDKLLTHGCKEVLHCPCTALHLHTTLLMCYDPLIIFQNKPMNTKRII